MEALLILAGLFVLYEVMAQQRTIAALTQNQTQAGTSSALPLPAYQTVAPASSNATQEESSATSAVSVGLNFIPVAGPAISAAFNILAGGLIAASAKRAAEAKNENAAVAAAVPGWDKAVAQVVAAYNAGQIAAGDVEQFLACPQSNDPTVISGQGLLWKNFWNECGPQVQPGRNGCQNGTTVQPSSVSYCGGTTYGASCCVAYDDLKNSCVAMLEALNKAEAQPGVAQNATVLAVYASKYGGVNRPAYTVTFKKPAAASVLAL
jgi:cytoskeletal protein RodZ